MDDVLINLLDAWIRILNKKYNRNVKREDIKQWDMHIAFPGLSDKELFGILNEEEFWDEVCPFYDAVFYLKKLKDEGHKIVVATASHYRTIMHKLDKAFFPYFTYLDWKDIIMINDKSLLKGDVIIDDNPDKIKHFDGLRLLRDAPYNQNTPENDYNFRVHNYEEVYFFIKIKDKNRKRMNDNNE